ncbi:PREDICTED: uncharacterized protein LOC109193373 [Ipomoea nil]|uniref:uncharacterized protein LOC109193373 n=1 Tax=Ipomoea nil TaxID=35883 RepID=UPI000900AB05|nr:PREDICTED: uncharacterized protein LOC109193373 [Ipomoea nil]
MASKPWTKPPSCLLKVNVNAATDQINIKIGLGFVLRDSLGAFVVARILPVFNLYNPNEAEAIGVREALKWLKALQYDNIHVEMDCLHVAKNIHHQHLISSFDLILHDIRELAKSFTNVSFLFAKRSLNRVAHLLAREAPIQEWRDVVSTSARQSSGSMASKPWTKLPSCLLKVNVDAATDQINGKKCLGFVLRDSLGAFVVARILPVFNLYKPNEAEAIGVREALKWLKALQYDNIHVEIDCLQVAKNIHHQHLISSFDLILHDIRELAKSFTNVSFLFAKQSLNRVAQLLARKAPIQV